MQILKETDRLRQNILKVVSLDRPYVNAMGFVIVKVLNSDSAVFVLDFFALYSVLLHLLLLRFHCLGGRGLQANFCLKSANRKSQIRKSLSFICYRKSAITQMCQSANRKSTYFYDQSANCKFAILYKILNNSVSKQSKNIVFVNIFYAKLNQSIIYTFRKKQYVFSDLRKSANHKKDWVRKLQIRKVLHVHKVRKSNKLFKSANLYLRSSLLIAHLFRRMLRFFDFGIGSQKLQPLGQIPSTFEIHLSLCYTPLKFECTLKMAKHFLALDSKSLCSESSLLIGWRWVWWVCNYEEVTLESAQRKSPQVPNVRILLLCVLSNF